jgi:hypothetical protein
MLLTPPPLGAARDAWAKAALAAAAFGNATAHADNSTMRLGCAMPTAEQLERIRGSANATAQAGLLVADDCGFCAALPADARCVPVAPPDSE